MVKLFVSGFPLDMDELELVKLFAPFGDVSTIKIIRDRVTKICKGYCFLEMKQCDAAEKAVTALDGLLIAGRNLTIRMVPEPNIPAKNIPQIPAQAYKRVERYAGPVKKKRPRKTSN